MAGKTNAKAAQRPQTLARRLREAKRKQRPYKTKKKWGQTIFIGLNIYAEGYRVLFSPSNYTFSC